ncbi:MAG: Y-family DNA polymerase [Firmicutes bacterium]|nr:Y-family DNA polymerase [Bacillota bacterium]
MTQIDRQRARTYLCIDLKSFYASVECVERGLDPMTTDLVVADPDRSEKTICLAVSPSLKAKGVKNRCRVFEIPKHLDYIMAVPRMKLYVDYAAEIYGVYLDYIAAEDIHVYSIDEVFIDVTAYLKRYGYTPREMALFLMKEIEERIGVRATCGIGTNMYLAKIALDITAKHSPDFIGYLDENAYINTLWDHRPLTDFWRIGPGTARKLARIGIDTMGGIARADEDMMYKMFGVDAELLIDHAWGREPTTIADIKAYKPRSNSLTSGQVLMRDYSFEEAKLIIKEMTDALCLDMTAKGLVAKSLSIMVGYSNSYNLPYAKSGVPLTVPTNSAGVIVPAVVKAYEKVVNPNIPIRRMHVSCNNLMQETAEKQMSFFDMSEDRERDVTVQKTVNQIKEKFGKNAVFKGHDLEEAATAIQRNNQIGGHRK